MKVSGSHFGTCVRGLVVLGVLCVTFDEALAQVIAPSFFTTTIQVQEEAEGTEFDDWAASGIPIATTDPVDNSGSVDIASIQIANDNDFIYLHVSYHDENSVGTFLGFDVDQDVATGFDVFSAGWVGAELAYQNDFPFQQDVNLFNTGDPLTGGPFDPPNGGALIFPFYNVNGSQKEYAIGLDVAFTNPSAPAFTSDTFNLLVYTDLGGGDVAEVITYTLAAPSGGVAGDYNGSGQVEQGDLDLVLLNWGDGWPPAITGWVNQQPLDDGMIDQNDLDGVLLNWGNSTPAATTAVPEPAGLVLVGWALAALFRCRRR